MLKFFTLTNLLLHKHYNWTWLICMYYVRTHLSIVPILFKTIEQLKNPQNGEKFFKLNNILQTLNEQSICYYISLKRNLVDFIDFHWPSLAMYWISSPNYCIVLQMQFCLVHCISDAVVCSTLYFRCSCV